MTRQELQRLTPYRPWEKPVFQISPAGFALDGRPLRLLSGALHYFRALPEQWPHRLHQLRAMGLNTVETYVP
jgi:beta-galactosidase